MATIHEIASYLQQGTRNKIVFCKDDIDSVKFLNVGKELATCFRNRPEEAFGSDTLLQLLFNKPQFNDRIGNYLAIENIGILFEPELKLDMRNFLSNYSKNQCLIIKTDSTIDNDVLYFLAPTDNVRVSLQGLSFKQI